MKVLVCGGRAYKDYNNVKKVLNQYPITTIVHGNAAGADTLADRYAKEQDIVLDVYSANWNLYGKNAGPIRNIQMLAGSNPDLVIAFPGGNGTNHMVSLAISKGFNVIQIPHDRAREK